MAADVNSGLSQLGGHRGYLPNFILEKGVKTGAIAADRTAKL
jgi:hypothetical protein